jgi:hypothetical protein
MKFRIIISFVLALAVLLTVAGCSSPPPQPVGTPIPTLSPTPEPTTPPTPIPTTKASIIPGPTDALPQPWPLSFSVEKAGMYSTTVITHFDGGKGLMYVLRMDVRVTHPDGTVVTSGVDKPKMGEIIELPGTSGTDRVEVMVTMASGQTYKVVDQQVLYKSLG